jgi:hypothetical protein
MSSTPQASKPAGKQPAHITTYGSQHAATPYGSIIEKSPEFEERRAKVTAIGYISCNVAGCGNVFFTRPTLSHHLDQEQRNQMTNHFASIVPTRSLTSICENCGMDCTSEQELRNHNILEHIISRRVHPGPAPCVHSNCSIIFESLDELKNHLSIDQGVLSWPCKDPHCAVRFSTQEKRDHHSQHAHSSEHQVICKVGTCGLGSSSKKDREQHARSVHGGLIPASIFNHCCQAPRCGEGFRSATALKDHVLDTHIKEWRAQHDKNRLPQEPESSSTSEAASGR